MTRIGAVASVIFAICVTTLGGCTSQQTIDFDPFDVGGRSGSQPITYDTLMRVAAAAHAGGDLAGAVAVYRRAAELDPSIPAPFVALGNTLLEMGQSNEAILAYQSALNRGEADPDALRGLARAYLSTGRPELAGAPLEAAYRSTPDDPKLLQLIGVADDLVGQHGEAQARYRRGLELLPHDPGLTINLALSSALSGNYTAAIQLLRPVATAPTGTPRQHQTLALIYGLAGDRKSAEQMGRLDLDAASVQHNLAYYERLQHLSPEARARALQPLGYSPGSHAAVQDRQ